MRLSVIIPAFNESAAIGETVSSAMDDGAHEVIVSDGGSSDDTRSIAKGAGATVMVTRPGRAAQMNEAAASATGDSLLFLHADTRLPKGFASVVRETLAAPGVIAGAFTLRIDSPRLSLRVIEGLARIRCNLFSLPYGDQAIFMRRDVFTEHGGWPDMHIMEDYELMRRLRCTGRVVVVPETVTTSARRWEKLGVLRTTAINQLVIAGYALGMSPEKLKRLYGRENGADV